MSLQMPNLDDRSFDDLLAEALDQIRRDLHTSWNDFSPGDPGVILLEAFSYLTEQMIYRLNRVPEKAYIAFLRMIGVGLKPPSAARVQLSFWQAAPAGSVLRVPRGTQVTSRPKGGEAVLFTTIEDLDIPPDSCDENTARAVTAYQASWVEEDLPGLSSGLPGQVFEVTQPPIVSPSPGLEMRLGMEVPAGSWQVDDWIAPDGRHFQVWQEVENFAGQSPDARVYRVDRQAGIIQFAPAAYLYSNGAQARSSSAPGHNGGSPNAGSGAKQALAAVPEKDRAVRVRYPVGGGSGGNIPTGLLDTIREPAGLAASIKVTNREPARGGLDAETLENALVRGPQEVFTQDRLVTARDFERTVLRACPEIARARAFALQDLWEHAQPGTVSINRVPALPASEYPTAAAYTKEALESKQRELSAGDARGEIEKMLQAQSPLGIRARLGWARYKRVAVSAEVTVPRGVETASVQQRLEEMLYRAISPLPAPPAASSSAGGQNQRVERGGWGFGDELHLAEVSRWIFTGEPNVSLLHTLELKIDSAPDRSVHALAADYFQPGTWYAASGQRLFRTINDAAGWEELLNLSSEADNPTLMLQPGMEVISEDQQIREICPSIYRPGVVALATLYSTVEPSRSFIYLTTDCGETWLRLADIDAVVEDMDWLQRAGRHILLLATSRGLKELHLEFDSQGRPDLKITLPIPVIPGEKTALPVNAVKVLLGLGGTARVAVAMDTRLGLYLSNGIDLSPVGDGTAFTRLDWEIPKRIPAGDGLHLVPPDIRCLAVQWCEEANRFLLWAGATAVGKSDPGAGCCRWVFDEQLRPLESTGRWFTEGWSAGSCLGLAFLGSRVLAATARGTVLVADVHPPAKDTPEQVNPWHAFPDPDSILPPRRVRFTGLSQTAGQQVVEEHIPFTAIATGERRKMELRGLPPLVLAGCGEGVFRSQDQGVTFEKVSWVTFRQWGDSITIPSDWLLVSGQHQVRVVEEDSAGQPGITRKDVGHGPG